MFSRSSTFRNCTFVRFGKLGCVSSNGPYCFVSPASISGRGMTQCGFPIVARSEEHTSELQSQSNLVCRLLLEKKNGQARLAFLDALLAGAARLVEHRLPRPVSLLVAHARAGEALVLRSPTPSAAHVLRDRLLA